MKAIITVDIGTTSSRASLYDACGRVLHMAQQENLPVFFDDGRVEQDSLQWQEVLLTTLKSCAQAARSAGLDPLGIAVTASRSSVIPVDKTGLALHPAIMWQDRRSADMAQAMSESNPLVYGKTGLKISPVFSAIKMRWLRHHRPDIWSKTHKLLGIQDWVLYILTGRFVTDQSFGSRTNLLNLETRCWDAELLKLFEVPAAMLCDLVAPGSVVGGLASSIASATGLPAGLPVVSAAGDQQCAALGLGLFSGKRAVSNAGTGSYLIGHSTKPALDSAMRLACNVSAVPGAYIVEAAVLTSGTIYRWFKESLCQNNRGSDLTFEQLNAEAAHAAAGCNGLLALPHFKGSGSPYWDAQARGVFFNLTLGTSRGEMARAILEGIAIELKASLELVEQLCGTVESVSVSGGMSKSELFNQIQSDVFERPVVRFDNNEATSLGAWIAAAVSFGLEASYPAAFERAHRDSRSVRYEPLAGNARVYARRREQSHALYQALATPALRDLLKALD
ncbi:MAG: FGGY-family carbohydrate kinase [Comamonadaceae bacterium]